MQRSTGITTALLALTLLAAEPTHEFVLAPLIGTPAIAIAAEGDTLLDIAYRNRVGFESLRRLNPEIDVWLPEPGTRVELPTQLVLPSGAREGLLLNIPEMRIFDFTVGSSPRVLAVAVGDRIDPTPIGRFAIGEKRVDPTWRVPVSIREERPELPASVPPGPENPLGDRWMRIGRTSYGVHGTNIRWSIGREATHGCVRLYNEDMHDVFERIDEGTPLTITYQPVKLGLRAGEIYLEVHPDLYALGRPSVPALLTRLLVLSLVGDVDYSSVERAEVEAVFAEERGVPVRIGRLRPDSEHRPTY